MKLVSLHQVLIILLSHINQISEEKESNSEVAGKLKAESAIFAKL